MNKLYFDEVVIDPQGNVIGYMGTGDKIIAYDAHIDTVGIGNIENWKFDPYEGYETDEEIGGRGVSDQCGGIVSVTYSPAMIQTAIQDMVDYLNGDEVEQDHVIACEIVTAENVTEYPSF